MTNNEFYLKVKKMDDCGRIDPPKRKGDCGHDVYATKSIVLKPKDIFKMPLGISFEVPDGYFAWVQERSSLGLKGITTVGNIIDSGYRGEIHAILINLSNETIKINKGDRIVQIIFQKYYISKSINYVKLLTDSERGHYKFGSTDDSSCKI